MEIFPLARCIDPAQNDLNPAPWSPKRGSRGKASERHRPSRGDMTAVDGEGVNVSGKTGAKPE
jgi:hypothetical protein